MSTEKQPNQYKNQRWIFKEFQKNDIEKIRNHFNINELLAKVLIHNTNQTDCDAIKQIVSPNKNLLTNYQEITSATELDKAFSRIKQAQKKKEKILVNGDPDADGISGTTILVTCLRNLGIQTDYRFPNRPVEGHGLQIRIINEAIEGNYDLIITSDCGTKDCDAVAYANEKNIDTIITDHHILGAKLPKATAIINPYLHEKQTDFQKVSGSAVSYMFCKALYHNFNVTLPENLDDLCLICATFGIISDRVPMTNPVNRLIVELGVECYKTNTREGVKALRELSEFNVPSLKARQLSRTVIPRLNAPGRIGNPLENIADSSIVVELLLLGKGKKNAIKAKSISKIFQKLINSQYTNESNNESENNENIVEKAYEVNAINEQRKRITAQIEEEIDDILNQQFDIHEHKIVIIKGENWNPGVIGIDTDRLKERFLRPAIILTTNPNSDYLKGSCRSIPKINIYKILDDIEKEYIKEHGENLFLTETTYLGKKKIISSFGGHTQACGFSIHKNNVSFFKEKVHEKINKLPKNQFEYHYDILSTLQFNDISEELINQLDELNPYGKDFEFPIFYLKNCHISKGFPFGNRYQQNIKKHVEFDVFNPNKKTEKFSSIGFGLWEKFCYVKANSIKNKFDIIFTPELSSKRKNKKKTSLRLNILDIRIGKD